MKHIREQDYVIALAIDGKTPDSVELSQKIRETGSFRYQFHCIC